MNLESFSDKLLPMKNNEIRPVAARPQITSPNQQAFPKLLATVGHELRTPLHGIYGTLRMMDRSRLSPDQIAQLDDIENATTELISLVNDVLEFSRLNRGHVTLSPQPTHLQDFLIATLKAAPVGMAYNRERVTLETQLDPSLKVHVLADTLRIKQVLINLINNALKYTEQGHVYVRAQIAKTDHQLQLNIEIEDTGVGIPQSQIARIFQPFSRIDAPYQRGIEGVGLGLTICQQLLDIMQGEIKAHSSYGIGSCFSVMIPLQQAPDPTHDCPDTQLEMDVTNSFKKPYRILVAEDHRINQKIMRVMLESLDCQVDVTDRGDLAVEMASQGNYDAILMDISLNEIDGIEATRIIRHLPPPVCHLPIIAVTAHALEEEHAEFLSAGIDAVVTKPMTEEDLIQTLKKHLEA